MNFVGFLVRLFSIILSFKERNSLTLNLPCGDLELEVRRKSDDDKVRNFLSIKNDCQYIHNPYFNSVPLDI